MTTFSNTVNNLIINISEGTNALDFVKVVENERKSRNGINIVSEILGENFKNVMTRAIKNTGWDDNYAGSVAIEYLYFLLIHKINPTLPIVPSKDIDEVWHSHILFTKFYKLTCHKLFRKFLHHTPSVSQDDENKCNEGYVEMLREYKRIFNRDPPSNIWTQKQSKKRPPSPSCYDGCG